MKPIRVLLSIILLLSLQACSLFRDKPPEYLNSEEGRPLEVPEDLDRLVFVKPLEITVPPMRTPSGDELNPGPPRTVSTGGRADANAFMAWSAEGVYLQVKDSRASVARRLGFAIQRGGMELLDQNEGGHTFDYVQVQQDDRGFFKKLLFWRNDQGPNYSGKYRTWLREEGEQTRVYLLYDDGQPANTGAAEHVLGIFMERLG